MSAASWTVAIFSAPSSSRVISNCSSSAIMISTVSRESAPRSTNLASAATASRSVPSCSEMMVRTFSRVSSACRFGKGGMRGSAFGSQKCEWGKIARIAPASFCLGRIMTGSRTARGSAARDPRGPVSIAEWI